jgi:crotonobetainyl-CoA:carnitine CoA-transferase CaiB-like acyl-CoA transferase
MRCRGMGAICVKLEPPPHPSAPKGSSGDPMSVSERGAYDTLHQGVRRLVADLKTDKGRAVLQRELAKADVLVTSFRPSVLPKLGLDWKLLHKTYPQLSMVAIEGAPGARAEEPGHDLTYMAENDLVTGLELPASLYADMGGSLVVSEAILQLRLQQLQKGKGARLQVALSEAAAWLGLPRTWGVTAPGAAVGGGHAGYRVYACKDGRVAMAALEPHFAASLLRAAGLADTSFQSMFTPAVHVAIAAFVSGKTRRQLDALALAKDIPLHTLK